MHDVRTVNYLHDVREAKYLHDVRTANYLHDVREAAGRPRSKASASGMTRRSLQGWIDDDFT
ncbi:hypothetical protein Y888_16090 [Mixta calida B021323]|nr:hypothetical protein Y888_16090 [Mixta calida B021323]